MLIDAYTDADLDLTPSLVDGGNFRLYCCQGTWIYDNVSTLQARRSAYGVALAAINSPT